MITLKTFIQRGEIIESVHNAKCLVKNSNLKTVFTTGHEKDLVFPRSAIKIFQAMPFISSNAHKIFNLNPKYLAISCSSHCGESMHIKVLKEWLKKTNISINNLKCGIHNPINLKSSNKLLLAGKTPSQLHNNCAGKHLAMITGCMARCIPIKNYISFNHPYQKLIRSSLEYFMGTKIIKKTIGVDGCSAPQYAFRMSHLASGMINLINEKNNKGKISKQINLLLNSIHKFPLLIGGTNRFDSEVIKFTKSNIFCKGGAEGVLLFVHVKKNIGGVIKITDGNERAIPPVAMKVFSKLNLLNKYEKEKLKHWNNINIINHAKKRVGNIFAKII